MVREPDQSAAGHSHARLDCDRGRSPWEQPHPAETGGSQRASEEDTSALALRV
jgi:hypothetical protein